MVLNPLDLNQTSTAAEHGLDSCSMRRKGWFETETPIIYHAVQDTSQQRIMEIKSHSSIRDASRSSSLKICVCVCLIIVIWDNLR